MLSTVLPVTQVAFLVLLLISHWLRGAVSRSFAQFPVDSGWPVSRSFAQSPIGSGWPVFRSFAQSPVTQGGLFLVLLHNLPLTQGGHRWCPYAHSPNESDSHITLQ